MPRDIQDNALLQTYDATLGCFVREISVCTETGVGRLVTYADSCPDMDACIERFQDLLPDIRQVQVCSWSNGQAVPDMGYMRAGERWDTFICKYRPGEHVRTR